MFLGHQNNVYIQCLQKENFHNSAQGRILLPFSRQNASSTKNDDKDILPPEYLGLLQLSAQGWHKIIEASKRQHFSKLFPRSTIADRPRIARIVKVTWLPLGLLTFTFTDNVIKTFTEAKERWLLLWQYWIGDTFFLSCPAVVRSFRDPPIRADFDSWMFCVLRGVCEYKCLKSRID